MEIIHWDLDPDHAVESSVGCLSDDQLVALPTETVYGLAGRLSELAISTIFEVKGRPADNPLIVHVGSVEMALACIEAPTEAFQKLTAAFWPGSLTLVMKKKASLADHVTCGLSTVAVRMPHHPAFLAILSALKAPLVAPSANLSGRPSPTQVSHVIDDLGDKVPLAIDGGTCSYGLESTVIDLSEENPRLLRPGAISLESLQAVLGKSIQCVEAPGSVVRSPGMKYRHYAPQWTKVTLLSDPKAFLDHAKAGEQCYAIVPFDSSVQALRSDNLYDCLRKADKEARERIYFLHDEHLRSDLALLNRLQKAASDVIEKA